MTDAHAKAPLVEIDTGSLPEASDLAASFGGATLPSLPDMREVFKGLNYEVGPLLPPDVVNGLATKTFDLSPSAIDTISKSLALSIPKIEALNATGMIEALAKAIKPVDLPSQVLNSFQEAAKAAAAFTTAAPIAPFAADALRVAFATSQTPVVVATAATVVDDVSFDALSETDRLALDADILQAIAALAVCASVALHSGQIEAMSGVLWFLAAVIAIQARLAHKL